MTPAGSIYARKKKIFSVSPALIWLSALFMGILASIPKIMRLRIQGLELAVDASIAFLFSLFVWYFNIYRLPGFSSRQITRKFFNRHLVWSLLWGIALMAVLVVCHQLAFPHYQFQSMMLMYQFRGILINLTIYLFLHLLYQGHYVQQINTELESSRAAHLGAQYELLKQQVNPHFLFNSLNTLKSMVEIQDRHAADFIVKLSDFYRFTLENRKQDIIPLSQEMTILQAYLFLLEARFEGGLQLDIAIDPAHERSCIPPFTLQLLIENCVKHNVISLERPLHIRLYSEGNSIVVENQLQLKHMPEVSTGTGLENINQRYQHLLHREITIEKDDAFFRIKLPVTHDDTHH